MKHGNIAKLDLVLASESSRLYGLPRMPYLAKAILIVRPRQLAPMLEIKHVKSHNIQPSLVLIKIQDAIFTVHLFQHRFHMCVCFQIVIATDANLMG